MDFVAEALRDAVKVILPVLDGLADNDFDGEADKLTEVDSVAEAVEVRD